MIEMDYEERAAAEGEQGHESGSNGMSVENDIMESVPTTEHGGQNDGVSTNSPIDAGETMDGEHGPPNDNEDSRQIDQDEEPPVTCGAFGNGRENASNVGITVMIATNSPGHRRWDKYGICVFCMKSYAKLSWHFFAVHYQEPDVKAAFASRPGSKERRLLMMKLANRGTYAHNCKVLQENSGILIPYRRPSEPDNPINYLPCEHCLAFLRRGQLWSHVCVCPMKASPASNSKLRVQARCAMLLPVSAAVSGGLKTDVIGRMIADEISLVARNDELICSFGARVYSKHANEPHMYHIISQKMRQLARLLLTARGVNTGVEHLGDLIDPSKFDLVRQAVQTVGGFSKESNEYDKPSLCLKLGHSIKKCAIIWKSRAMQLGDSGLRQRAQDFLELCDLEWSDRISSAALRTLSQRQWNKPKRLPLAEDIAKLTAYLHEQIAAANVELSKPDSNKSDWQTLARLTLVQVMLFNRRRSGEVERIPRTAYENRSRTIDEDVVSTLSSWEQHLCRSLARFEVRGKRGRKVPVPLTHEMQSSVDFLLETRDRAGVSSENFYLFANPMSRSLRPVRGSDSLRYVVNKCGIQHPDSVTSTRLRKHIATMSQLLCLKDNEMDIVANFMGHDIRVHREYYRLPEETLQMAKVSKILMLLDKGQLQTGAGKSLDDVQCDVNGKYSTDG
jgi:hypothetical protein